MTDCELFQEKISCLADGELTPEETAQVEAHIAVCPVCRRLYGAFTELSAALSEDIAEPPHSIRANVMAEIHTENRRKHSGWLRIVPAAACLAVVILAGARAGVFDMHMGKSAPEANEIGSGYTMAAAPKCAEPQAASCDTDALPQEKTWASDEAAAVTRNDSAPAPEAEGAACCVQMVRADGEVLTVRDADALYELLAPAGEASLDKDAQPDYTLDPDGERTELYIAGDRVIAVSGQLCRYAAASAAELERFIEEQCFE